MMLILWIILELFFTFLLPSAEAPNSEFKEDYKVLAFDPSCGEGRMTIGKLCDEGGRWSINRDGWNSPIEYEKEKSNKTRVAVIGDSYIEALQVDNDQTLQYLLQEKSNQKIESFGFGISGAPLSQYLNVARYVESEFNPDIFVFMLIHNDFDESIIHLHPNKRKFLTFENKNNSWEELQAYKSPNSFKAKLYRKVLMKSALFRYLWINLKVSAVREKFKKTDNQQTFAANVEINSIEDNFVQIEEVTRIILAKIHKELQHKRVILLMDAPRKSIYNGLNLENDPAFKLNTLVQKITDELQMEFIDLSQKFEFDYKINQKKFEFSNDFHWSQYGHKVVSDTLYNYITKQSIL